MTEQIHQTCPRIIVNYNDTSWNKWTTLNVVRNSHLIVTLHRFLLTEHSNYIQYSFPIDPIYASLKYGKTDLLITRSDVIFRRTLEYTVNWAFPLPSTTQEQLSRRWPLYGHVSGATNLLQRK